MSLTASRLDVMAWNSVTASAFMVAKPLLICFIMATKRVL
jgi:hypothetical protein